MSGEGIAKAVREGTGNSRYGSSQSTVIPSPRLLDLSESGSSCAKSGRNGRDQLCSTPLSSLHGQRAGRNEGFREDSNSIEESPVDLRTSFRSYDTVLLSTGEKSQPCVTESRTATRIQSQPPARSHQWSVSSSASEPHPFGDPASIRARSNLPEVAPDEIVPSKPLPKPAARQARFQGMWMVNPGGTTGTSGQHSTNYNFPGPEESPIISRCRPANSNRVNSGGSRAQLHPGRNAQFAGGAPGPGFSFASTGGDRFSSAVSFGCSGGAPGPVVQQGSPPHLEPSPVTRVLFQRDSAPRSEQSQQLWFGAAQVAKSNRSPAVGYAEEPEPEPEHLPLNRKFCTFNAN